jgi:hypothetical protein
MPGGSLKYRQLSPAQVRLLYAIWHLEFPTRRSATIQDLSRELDKEPSSVRKLIWGLRKLCKQHQHDTSENCYIESHGFSTGERGNHVNYRLAGSRLITMPLTALIVAVLFRLPREKGHPIDEIKFCKYLSKHYGDYEVQFWQKRLALAIERDYILPIDPHYIELNDRAWCEQEYINLISELPQHIEIELEELGPT